VGNRLVNELDVAKLVQEIAKRGAFGIEHKRANFEPRRVSQSREPSVPVDARFSVH
jgi:hypothetical protein